MKSKQAFTLIELLVIIVIIGILATLATTSLKPVTGRARDGRRLSDINAIRKALELYKLNNEIYPPENLFNVNQPLKYGNDTLLGKIPANPKTVDGPCAINEYLYHQDNNGLSYHLNYCLGSKVQDAGPGTCIATPSHYCNSCSNGTCVGRCGANADNGCGQPCPNASCSGGYTCGLCEPNRCGQNRTTIPYVGGTSFFGDSYGTMTCNQLCQANGFPGGYNALGPLFPYGLGGKPYCCNGNPQYCINYTAFCGYPYIGDSSTCICTPTCFNQ